MNFENTIITKYYPLEEKDKNTGDVLSVAVIECESELDNSIQVGYLFTSMVKGLMEVTFTNPETGESYMLESATIKPFNVKQKKIKFGKGDDSTVVMAEFAQMKIITPINDDGEILKALYPYFSRTLAMSVEDLPASPFQKNEEEIEDEIGAVPEAA